MTKVFIDGSAGTTGLRIFERLSKREDIELIKLSEELRKDPVAREMALGMCDIAFLCLPDDAAREAANTADSRTVIIDTSTAHRTTPGWAYGFPELSEKHFQRIKTSRRIAVPGCHASGFIALVAPLTAAGMIPKDTFLSVTSVTGYSGGGKKMIAQYEAEGRDVLLDSPRQYALSQSHKHLPEMVKLTGLETAPAFSPIVSDFYSGMAVTVPISAKALNGTAEDIRNIYRELYKGPVVSFDEALGADGLISANMLAGKDGMKINVLGNSERLLLAAVYDNLGKGASGAAIECMNIVMGLAPETGLEL